MPDPSSDDRPRALSNKTIFLFWAPLAATWLMMAAEGPFLAAVIARLDEPTLGLAAYGVALAIAVLVESPVIMLMGAVTALLEDATSYRRLRAFANGLNAFATGLLLVVLIPSVHRWLFDIVLGLPDDVARMTYGALWCFLPWPAAIGYRRFLQGVLIRSGRTRLVAYGTVIRLLGMATAAVVWGPIVGLPGARVGAAALSSGVVLEALAARWMARGSIRQTLAKGPHETGPRLEYREIAAFYYPLALTSLLGLSISPLLTFFMGRSTSPVQSLAVFPVVHALVFLFRALGLSFQDAAIALLGRGREGYDAIARFALLMGVGATALYGVLVLTPLADLWFRTVSGLSIELAAFALPAARVVAPLPFLGVWLSLQRGVLMRNRRTRPITFATGAEVLVIGVSFVSLAWGVGTVGVTAAFAAILLGRVSSNAYLIRHTRRLLRTSVERHVHLP